MIKLFDNWVVLVDKDNYTLAEYLGVKKDKHGQTSEKYKAYGYYMTMSSTIRALKEIARRKALSEGSLTLSEALQTIKDEDDKIFKLLESVKWEEDDGK